MNKHRNRSSFFAIAMILASATLLGDQPSEIRVGPFSEEDPPATCKNGYALKGLVCSGSNCDNKTLICERYYNRVDGSAKHRWSRWFSEESPNSESSKSDFVSGVGCSGRYCDNIRLRLFRSSVLENSESCHWSERFSEERPNQMMCNAGEFVAGLRCTGGYCDNISLYCCAARKLK